MFSFLAAAVPTKISKRSVPSKKADGGRRTGGGYADPGWVYEEIDGHTDGKSENLVTSTPRASATLQDVPDDNCFTEEQVS